MLRSTQIVTRAYSTGAPKEVHAVASKGFNLQTDNYGMCELESFDGVISTGEKANIPELAQTRPAYPQDLVDKIKSLVSSKDNRVVDLAAGTGLMTKSLVESGLNVTAVEPAEKMRRKLVEILPQVNCVEGTSWNIPVKDSSLDAVVIAQAFHWFDDITTLRELHRVLKPTAFGVLAWNLESSERSDWVAKFRNAYEVYDVDLPQFHKMDWKKVFVTDEAKELFQLPYTHETFKNDFLVKKSDLWRRVLSKSYVSCLDADKQEALKLKIESILQDVPAIDDQDRVLVPHDSHLVYFQKK